MNGRTQFGRFKQLEKRSGVEARRLEQNLTDNSPEVIRRVSEVKLLVGQDVPHQRKAVRVQTARCTGNNDIAVLDAMSTEHVVTLHNTGRRPRNVIVVGAKQTGVLSRFASNESGARFCTRIGDALDD